MLIASWAAFETSKLFGRSFNRELDFHLKINILATLLSSRLGTISLDIMSITQQIFFLSYQVPWGLGIS